MRSFATIALLALALAACGGQSTSDTSAAGGSAGTGGSAGSAGASQGATGGGSGVAAGGGAGASGNVGGWTGGGASGGGAAGMAGTSAGMGGGAGTGGSSGGGAGAGGGSQDGGSQDGGACVSSTVTFQIKAASGSWCLGQSCSTGWVSIRDASGNLVNRSNLCQTSCDTCNMTLCPPLFCALPSPMLAAGAIETWDGTFFESSTCGANGRPCVAKGCAHPAKYTAVMCAAANPSPDSGTGCSGVTAVQQTCVEVPFDYPPTAPVVGTLKAP
jgi:hypothetical protein